MAERDSPSDCIHRVRTEPCSTQGKPLEKPSTKMVRKRLSHSTCRDWRRDSLSPATLPIKAELSVKGGADSSLTPAPIRRSRPLRAKNGGPWDSPLTGWDDGGAASWPARPRRWCRQG